MRPVGQPGKFHWETASVRWVEFAEAPGYIRQTTNKLGRDRDLAVLEAAQRAYKRFLAAVGMDCPGRFRQSALKAARWPRRPYQLAD
jgi:hypothetical protein